MSARRTLRALLLIGALGSASPLAAQVCLELPIAPAGAGIGIQLVRSGSRTSPDGYQPSASASTALGVRGGYDLAGSLALGGSYTYATYDQVVDTVAMTVTNHTASVRVGRQMYLGGASLCPVLDAGIFSFRQESPDGRADARTGGLLAAGWTLEHMGSLQDVRVLPFASAELLVVMSPGRRDPYGYEQGGEILPKLQGRAGMFAAYGAFFAGAHVEIVFPGSDPRFWLQGNTADSDPAGALAVTAGLAF